jgi:hypothetical protein
MAGRLSTSIEPPTLHKLLERSRSSMFRNGALLLFLAFVATFSAGECDVVLTAGKA